MLMTLLAALALEAATSRTEITPKFMNGVHMACEAAFDVVVQDTAYNQGKPVTVAGSFGLYNWPDKSRVFVAMKLGVSLEGMNYMPPTNAYVLNGYKTNLAEQLAQSDAELQGFRLFVFNVSGEQTLEALWRIATTNELNVAYTLRGGTMPQTFPVIFTPENGEDWRECLSALVNRDVPA